MEETPATVVIVEDNIDLANLFATWLGEGFTVKVAHDRATACHLLDEAVDVVLLDRNLPNGSGDDVLTMVRNTGIDCHVVMVTAMKPNLELIEMDCDDYLCKPVTREELCDTVEQLIIQADYHEGIQELYTLAKKKSLLETQYSTDILTTNEKYTALVARFDDLQQELDGMVWAFTDEQYRAELDRLSMMSD